ncbi:MAG: 23S rRNA (pseudouridine(1915)-N(3))-methyltransferase RlmH [Candidatus Fonsibacter lacus]
MKIKILCLGRLNKDEENELCNRYEIRLKSLKNSGIANFAIEHISIKELETIVKNKKEKKIIFLSENGQDFNTDNFCKKLKKLIATSIKETLFIIGEPEGFKKNLNKDSFEEICLSKLTFTHSLARVILTEQIYRCATIMVNHPYHR